MYVGPLRQQVHLTMGAPSNRWPTLSNAQRRIPPHPARPCRCSLATVVPSRNLNSAGLELTEGREIMSFGWLTTGSSLSWRTWHFSILRTVSSFFILHTDRSVLWRTWPTVTYYLICYNDFASHFIEWVSLTLELLPGVAWFGVLICLPSWRFSTGASSLVAICFLAARHHDERTQELLRLRLISRLE